MAGQSDPSLSIFSAPEVQIKLQFPPIYFSIFMIYYLIVFMIYYLQLQIISIARFHA